MIQEPMLRELGLMPPAEKTQEPRSKPPEPVVWKPAYPGEEPPF